MLARRQWIAGACTLATARPTWSAEPIEVLTADVRPLSIADGPRRGIVLDIVRDCLAAAGCEARLTFLPFAEALRRTEAQPGTLMAPLARSPQREAGFSWIGKVIDVPQALGRLRGRTPADLEGASRLARVGVVRAGVQESFLRDKGLANLVPFDGARDAALALADEKIDAWYGTATEIVLQFEAIGRAGAVEIGPTIQAAAVWLAGNRDMRSAPVGRMQEALAERQRSGAIERVYRSYVQG